MFYSYFLPTWPSSLAHGLLRRVSGWGLGLFDHDADHDVVRLAAATVLRIHLQDVIMADLSPQHLCVVEVACVWTLQRQQR